MAEMKFEIEIPKGAKWVAQDADGAWYAYKGRFEPVYSDPDGAWVGDELSVERRRYEPIAIGPKPNDASQELYEVVWE